MKQNLHLLTQRNRIKNCDVQDTIKTIMNEPSAIRPQRFFSRLGGNGSIPISMASATNARSSSIVSGSLTGTERYSGECVSRVWMRR